MYHLAIADYAAIVAAPGGPETVFGLARGAAAIPMGLRRRMSRFEICAVRCALGLVQPETEETLVLASRYGGMATAYALLESLAAGDILSPSDFSISVHNAAPGLASQIARNRAGHTAVASDARTFAAGLTEAAARIADGETSVVLVFAEQALPDVYAEVEEIDDLREVWLAVRLVPDTGGDAQDVGQGRAGACALVEALETGRRRVAWRAGSS
ncbi:MAG: beta-ketoacyl synthase chain length factor [Alphaproteobacteria bacterium]|nr:beta-ketoacyl synthase chain length factor [Alphaproteobacteria bacterium]